MRGLITWFLILASGFVTTAPAPASAQDLGKELILQVRGGPKFGEQFEHDSNGTFWDLTFVTTLTDKDIQSVPLNLKWNLYNSKTGSFLSPLWQDTQKDALLVGQFEVADRDTVLSGILPIIRNITIVFGEESGGEVVPLYFMNTGKLCAAYPILFMDLTTGGRGCDIK